MGHNISDCYLVELPKISAAAGNITVVSNEERIIPFNFKRIFYLYDIQGGASRGAHAHRESYQFLIAASGSFEIILDDGFDKKKIILNKPYYGLFIPCKIWTQLVNFSSGSICMVLTSHNFEESDYIRDYREFKVTKYDHLYSRKK